MYINSRNLERQIGMTTLNESEYESYHLVNNQYIKLRTGIKQVILVEWKKGYKRQGRTKEIRKNEADFVGSRCRDF